ncbi:hypothetical protein J6590_028898 [Homalodisca vitripennis]|nr:hypothetical protein J6590_028898 [Homalodisca vitripennis]
MLKRSFSTEYRLAAVVRSRATVENMVQDIGDLAAELGEENVVIVLVGTNDNDMKEQQIFLCIERNNMSMSQELEACMAHGEGSELRSASGALHG